MPIIEALPETPLVLDSVIFTHLRNKHHYVLEAIKNYYSITKDLPALTSITIFEATWGTEKELAQNKITKEKANEFRIEIDFYTQRHRILPLDYQASKIAAHIYAYLSQQDRNKHWRDLFIIATALAHNYGFVTQNRKDAELIAKYLPEEYKFLRLAIWKP